MPRTPHRSRASKGYPDAGREAVQAGLEVCVTRCPTLGSPFLHQETRLSWTIARMRCRCSPDRPAQAAIAATRAGSIGTPGALRNAESVAVGWVSDDGRASREGGVRAAATRPNGTAPAAPQTRCSSEGYMRRLESIAGCSQAVTATHRWSASAITHLGVDHLFYGHGSPGQRCTSVVTCASPRSESSSLYTDGSLGWCDTTAISAANRPGPIDQTCRSTTRVS